MEWIEGKDHSFALTPDIGLTALKWGQTLFQEP
jgi:hypothetical protein